MQKVNLNEKFALFNVNSEKIMTISVFSGIQEPEMATPSAYNPLDWIQPG